MNSILPRLVAWLANLYSRLPVKPCRPWLRKAHNAYITFAYRQIVKKKIDGINYELDLREAIDHAMYFKGSREPGTSQALKKLCREGDVVMDIGANVGSHALPMASYVGESGRVYAFEPVPWAIAKLRRNITLNRFNNLMLEQIALSDVNDEVEMKLRASFKIDAKSGVGENGKIDEDWWSECDLVRVKLSTLDSYVTDHQIHRLDLIKLDVDGFEGKVIRGAMDTLRKFKPYIIMEIAPAWLEMRGDNVRDILQLLETLDYKLYNETDFKKIKDINARIDALSPEGGFNVLASVNEPGMAAS